MSYGDYNGPNKADKGQEGGSCNRTLCQAPDAIWFNHGSHAWYCADCREAIEFDHVNFLHWKTRWQTECGHPQFETRAMMDERIAAQEKAAEPGLCMEIMADPFCYAYDFDLGTSVRISRKEQMQFDAAQRPAEIHTMTRQQRRRLAREGKAA